MSTTAPTRPTLLSIEQGDKAIRFKERGKGGQGVVSTIQPGNPEALQRAIDMVNEYGGPNAWKVEEVEPADTLTDGTGRVWTWSEIWGGYRSEGMVTHGYETIKSQWGIA